MASLGDIIKISQADYDTLVTNGSITKDGVTYTYSDSNLYLVEGVNDIVKLWTNADPNNQYGFTNTNAINVSNLSSYKYLIIKYKYYYSSTNQNWGPVFITIEYKSTGDFVIFGANNQSGCEISASRNFIISNNTITFGHAYCVNIGSTNSELNDHFCIPLEIYGTNDIKAGSNGVWADHLYKLDVEITGLVSGNINFEVHTNTYITASQLDAMGSNIYYSSRILGNHVKTISWHLDEALRCLFYPAYSEDLSISCSGYCQSDISRPCYNIMLDGSARCRGISSNGWWYFSYVNGSTTAPSETNTVKVQIYSTRVA